MIKQRWLAGAALAALLAVGVVPVVDGATATSWKAPLGIAGYNGYATLVTTSTGVGTVRLVAKHLTARATYPIELQSGSCTGPKLFGLTSAVASSTGTIVKSYPLSAARVTQALVTSKLFVKIGSSTRVRCGRFALVVPTGATSGTTIKVPASPYGDAAHLHTVQAFETWTDPDGIWTPAPGNVMVTALVRIDALGEMSANPFDYRVRDPNGLQYEPTVGRDPALHDTELSAGQFVAGWVTFEVPAVQATNLTLIYSPSLGVTVLIKLTPLPSGASTPTPTPTPVGPCVPTEILCMGSTLDFGNYTLTVDSISTWAGDATTVPAPGHVFKAIHLTETVKASAPIVTAPTFAVSSGTILTPGELPDLVQPTDVQPMARTYLGYVTFDVPTTDAGSLYLTINSSVLVRLF